MKLSIFKFISLMLLVPLALHCSKSSVVDDIGDLTPREGDYFVSTSGDDNNPGNDSLPWRTIQHAVDNMEPGKVLIVKPGNYPEHIKIKKSGSSEGARMNIFSETLHTAKCGGFIVEANFITIDGFDIETSSPYWTGINVKGGDYIDIRNCYVHDCPSGGIRITGGAQNPKVVGNKIDHNGLWGITFIASNGLIENNEITRCVQYHPKGPEPGLVGQDADGLRIFGSGHVIRGNKILDIGDPSDGANKDPHVDAIQTWDGTNNGAPIMTNTIIEGNYIRVTHPTGKGLLMETSAGNACHNIIIRNNIIEFSDIGVGAYNGGTFRDIQVYNNVFKARLNHDPWGTSVYFKEVANFAYVNIITVDCHPEARKILGGSGNVDYNLHWYSDGSTRSMAPAIQEHDMDGVSPLFVTYSVNHGESDYHLQAGSPAIDKGYRLESVVMDFDSVPRPQGSTHDIGAFEYNSK